VTRRPRGMTLIELLIVFSIVGLLVALVGPATSGLMDKARGQEEWLTLERKINDLAFRAFAEGQPVSITGRGAEVFWTVGDAPRQSLPLSRLFVDPEQTVEINARGVATPDRLVLRQAGRERVLVLNRWMARG
jgi:prepilin-type N-terminal cleavage/methylation domain-containing protein